jgi:hypothetical protein
MATSPRINNHADHETVAQASRDNPADATDDDCGDAWTGVHYRLCEIRACA